jgi:outer membrane protein TolC
MKHHTLIIRGVATALALSLVLSTSALAADVEDKSLTFTVTIGETFTSEDGSTLGSAFLDENNRMMAPLRALAEKLSLNVVWDASSRTATFSGANASGAQTEACFTAGSNRYTVTVDGHTQNEMMDTVAVIVDGHTYAPIRYLASAFGYQVGWNAETRTATITNGDLPETDPTQSEYISFSTLNSQVRAGSATYLALEENIAAIESLDYDSMRSDLRDQLNALADALFFVYAYSDDSYTQSSLQSAYDSMRDTFDKLKSGELQQDNADLVRQLRNAQDQILMGAQTLYIAILSMEQSLNDLNRSLDTLDRSIAEMELRYELGQISALTLQQVESSRATLLGNLSTLETSLTNYKAQMQVFLGQTPSGTLSLQSLPEVTQSQLSNMNYEKDLAAAMNASWELYSAKLTLDDAEETWKDAQKDYDYGTNQDNRYLYEQSQHTWQAAQYTYNATVDNFKLSFQELYSSVPNYNQLLLAAETTLAYQQQNYEAMALKYQLGTISYNDLLDAEDTLNQAISAVNTAKSDLFTAYNNYCWAVNQGIL